MMQRDDQMMKDSTLDVNWLQATMAANPPCVLENGNIFSGPVRLSFPNLMKPSTKVDEQTKQKVEGNYNCAVLFPIGADLQIFYRLWTELAYKEYPEYWDAANQRFVGLESPFHDQNTKAFGAKPLEGYTPGAIYFNSSSRFKPPIVDAGQNPIVDEKRVYPGVWAFLAFNLYVYGKSPPRPKKGCSFGLQSVMIIADDKNLGGAGADPKKDFAAVKINAQTNGAAMFGGAVPGGHVGAPGNLPVHALPPAAVPGPQTVAGLSPEEMELQ